MNLLAKELRELVV